VRALLEGAAAREFAERATDAHVAELRGALVLVEQSENDSDALLNAKDAFYRVLFEGAGNTTIRQIIESLQARVAVLRASSLRAPNRPKQSVVEIRAIVEAIERRDAEAAADAASYHVRQASHTLFTQIGGEAAPAAEHLDA
jgi:Transcriptional regulators